MLRLAVPPTMIDSHRPFIFYSFFLVHWPVARLIAGDLLPRSETVEMAENFLQQAAAIAQKL